MENNDNEMEVENPGNAAPAQNIRRQVTCSSCGQVGHTSRSRNCPNRAGNGAIVNEVEVPQVGGQIPQVPIAVVVPANIDGVGVNQEALVFVGGLEGPGNDHPEELQEVDQPAVPAAQAFVIEEWPEIQMPPLQPGVNAEAVNVPPFANEFAYGTYWVLILSEKVTM